MDLSRKYLKLKCDICNVEYSQQERVYNIALWKNRCKKHRKKIHTCKYCGIEVSVGYDKCKKCNGKLIRLPDRFCRECGIRIQKHSTLCLPCHNKQQDKGKSTERTKFNNSDKWNDVRIKCFERDNYTCVECGDGNYKGRGKCVVLNAHHIKSWKDHEDLRLILNNLKTVCEKCHKIIHSK